MNFTGLAPSVYAITGISESVKGISNIAGTFSLFFEGEYTDDINFDASAATVKARLEKLSTIGPVSVQRDDTGNGYKWTVSFISNVGNLRMMQASAYRYEIQHIWTTGGSPTPLSGQFTISYGGDSVNVNFDSTADQLRAALQSMPSVGAVEVSQTADINGQYQWLVTFRALIGKVPLLTVDPHLLLGSNAQVHIEEIVPGSNATLLPLSQHPRLAVQEKVAGLPSYTGEYIVDSVG